MIRISLVILVFICPFQSCYSQIALDDLAEKYCNAVETCLESVAIENRGEKKIEDCFSSNEAIISELSEDQETLFFKKFMSRCQSRLQVLLPEPTIIQEDLSKQSDCKTSAYLSLDKMNVMYEKIPNNFNFSVANKKSGSFTLSCDQGEIISKKGSGIVKNLEPGVVKIFVKKDDQDYTQFAFRVKELPVPILKLLNNNSQVIQKSNLSNLHGIGGVIKNFDWNMRTEVLSYSAEIHVGGKLYSTFPHSQAVFSTDFKKAIQNLQSGHIIIFKDINYQLILNAGQENSEILKTLVEESIVYFVE